MSVVVGVSPTTGSPTALRWGAEEARLRGLPLRAVMAWRTPRPPAAPGGRPPSGAASLASDDYATAAETALRTFVADAFAGAGDPADVECVVVRGSAVKALLTAADGAHLLVIGEPQPGRMASVRTSLVAPQVVLNAPCAVVVMPNRAVVGAPPPLA